jgi:hypothetical protein
MRIFITGATGLVGRHLVVDRLGRGDQVVVLSRSRERAERLFAAGANPNVTVIEGNPAAPGAWQSSVDGCDAVVHLAGAGIADQRWSEAYKQTIVQSRVDSTHQIVRAIAEADDPPRTLVSGSAVGYYGATGDDPVDETASAGDDFLADLCVRWEDQAHRAEEFGVRVVFLRIGVVLDGDGGALNKIVPPFKFFMGGPIGNGRQYMSWIHWRDLIGLIDLGLRVDSIRGPLNGTAPNPITAGEMGKAIGRALRRPSWLPVPRAILRITVGEFADFILASQRIIPGVAQRNGYDFIHSQIDGALQAVFGGERATEDSVTSVGAPIASPDQPGPNTPVKLLAMAVDGTLLRSDGRIPEGVMQACRTAERHGCVVVLATSRPPRAIRSIVQMIDVLGPSINIDGALIWNPVDQRSQYHEALAGAIAGSIIRDARELHADLAVALEVLDQCYTDHADPRLDAARFLVPDAVVPLDDLLIEGVTRVTLLGLPDQISDVADMARQRYWKTEQVAMFMPDPQTIQFTSRLVDKGIALQRIASRLGAEREQVMAIGNDVNDLGMLEWAGFSVAMASAELAVRSIADTVVPSNDDLGVARAIQRYVVRCR